MARNNLHHCRPRGIHIERILEEKQNGIWRCHAEKSASPDIPVFPSGSILKTIEH